MCRWTGLTISQARQLQAGGQIISGSSRVRREPRGLIV